MMLRFEQNLNDCQARSLLRLVRDLNLGPCGIEVTPNERVQVTGCISLDHPVESGVRYCLQEEDGAERILRMVWGEGSRLHLSLISGRQQADIITRELEVELRSDRHGRISAPELGARLDPVGAREREVEHFLRRIVRAICA